MGRPFYDFVAPKDEDLVRSWIDTCKSWGVNERGQPSDGGFGFGKFTVFVPGRDSRAPPPPPQKRVTYGRGGSNGRARTQRHAMALLEKYKPENEILVDAIFSAHSDGMMAILRKA